jgi:hypothetical protein
MGHFFNREEVAEIKLSWNMVIGDDSGGHGINILIKWAKQKFEMYLMLAKHCSVSSRHILKFEVNILDF